MSGGKYSCWNRSCDFRSYRPWIKPPRAIHAIVIDNEISSLIGQCLHAAAYGPFFVDSGNTKNPYWEYETLLGFNVDEAKGVSKQWPDVDVTDVYISEFIGCCITWLLSYPHNCEDIWHQYITPTKSDLNIALKDWQLEFQKCT
jgi:hypothetical protein